MTDAGIFAGEFASATEGRAMAPRPRHPARFSQAACTESSGEPAAGAPAPRRGWRRRRESLDPHAQALREARLAANRKMGFLAHFVPYAAVCTFLLFVAGARAAMVVAFAWGIAIAIHFFFAVLAPDLRRRLLEQEIERRVRAGVREQRRSWEGQRARSVQQLSASLAHEIRNPITAARSLVQQMGEDPASGEQVEYARVALEELERVERSISHLLRFAREEDLRLEETRLDGAVEGALESLREAFATCPVAVERELEPVLLRADPEKLRRVVVNLVRNALDAMRDAGTRQPRLRLQAGENLARTEAWLRVEDNGPGMDAEQLARIWSPFHTSKREGTGLGLAITRKLVEAHGGSVEVESEPGHGTRFVVILPKDPEAPAEPE